MSADTFTIGVSASQLVETLGLPDQQRAILSHLLAGKNITQLKAAHVYHVANLPDVIMKLRRKGYRIVTDMCDDEVGGKYASYTLA
jgi:hypothetical protein